MVQVESTDWASRRVFLHLDTVSEGVSGILIYAEIRDEIFANTSNGQNYFPPLTKEGGRPKGGGKFTPTFTEWREGWRLVPHPNGGTPYRLDILDEIISLDGLSDRDVFDRSGLATNVDIDSIYSPVEVREISGGSGLTAEEQAQLLEIYQILGLQIGAPMTVTPTSRTAGTIAQAISGDGETTTTVTRQ